MTILHDIAGEITRLGEGTIDDMAVAFPHLSRDQIKSGMRNAQQAGLIKVLRHEKRRPTQKGSGVDPAIWGPQTEVDDEADEPLRKPVDTSKWKRPVSFVFDLGRHPARR